MKALRLLVTESIQHMVEYMEGILETKKADGGSKDKDKDGKDKDGRKDSYEKYLRMWKLMEVLRDEKVVDRQQLVASIFNEHPKELDAYLAAGIIRYIIKGDLHSKDTTEISQNEAGNELPVRERVYVAAGSPRLRTAFRQIIADPQMRKQYAGVEFFLKKQKLKDKEKELNERRKELFDEIIKNSERVAHMVAHTTQWKDALGVEDFSQRIQSVLKTESQMQEVLGVVEVELSKIRAELQ